MTIPRPISYLDPKNDLAFKRLFGEHVDLLKSFLNALLPLPENAVIEELEYLSPEQVPEVPLIEKYSIVDVKCKDSTGRIFIVEMQMLWNPYFEQRVVFNAASAYVKQLGKGMGYDMLYPVYALALINQTYDKTTDKFYHHFQIVEAGEPKRTIKGLEFVFVELPKFKPATRTEKKLTSVWLQFMTEVGLDQQKPQVLSPELQTQPELVKAAELLQVSAFNEEELAAYKKSEDAIRSHMTLMSGARQEGKAEGEHGKAVAIARQMLIKGMDVAVIADLTGLSIEIIKPLRN